MKHLRKLLLIFTLFLLTATPAYANTDHAPRIRAKNGTSTNWSGYAVTTGLVSDAKGSWVVPVVTCTSTNTYSSAWVGIDGYSNNTVEQIGTEQDCRSGQPTYYAWYEMYPKPSFRINNVPVKAGDNINAEVKYVNGKFVLTLANATTGKSFTTTQKGKGQRQSAEWIMEAPWSGGVLPLANFGAIPFSHASTTVNGTTGSINAFAYDPITMVISNTDSTVKASPSGLKSGGSSFSVNWYHE